jgi:glycerol-3-phosphate dehydrogenase
MQATARVVINATGPWVDDVLARVTPTQAPASIELVRGTHLELPAAPLQANYYVEAPQDGRAVFVMPRGDHVLVGTTERSQAAPAPVAPSAEELEYLQTVVRKRFPHWPAARHEPVRAWAGLRVLPRATGDAFGRSRETLMLVDRGRRPRLLTVCGGKLTTYRAAAQQALARVAGNLPVRTPGADTATEMLTDPGT